MASTDIDDVVRNIRFKRTAVSGRLPSATDSSNTSFIDRGQFSFNTADQKMLSSNGTAIFEVGSNLTNLSVTNDLTVAKLKLGDSVGSNGQFVASTGEGLEWREIPSGYTGSRGFTGSASTVAGPTGYTGSTGQDGLSGSQGPIGYTGSVGAVGFVGSRGDLGYTGSVGSIGYTGSRGETGLQGLFGYTGSAGQNGSVGPRGYTGSRGSVGFIGSRGDLGFTGSAGTGGPQGYVGSRGVIGPTGYTGSKSNVSGPIGYTGSKGDPGAGAENTFESVSKNIKSYPYEIAYLDDNISTITYSLGTQEIIKTLNYTDDVLTSIVLSGDIPPSIDSTKTLVYSDGDLTKISYS